jgi:diadenosine tetraphosphate (Ap4A) HIT family hydrolase
MGRSLHARCCVFHVSRAELTLLTVYTAIHGMVDRCRRADYPAAVAKLHSGWVVMGERQVLPGYCLLLPDPVVADLNALHAGKRSRFLADMALVGDALLVSTAALRINYAIFGNVEPALHAHIFPRSAAEPAATRTAQPWALDWTLAPIYADAAHGDLKLRIAAQIMQMRASEPNA